MERGGEKRGKGKRGGWLRLFNIRTIGYYIYRFMTMGGGGGGGEKEEEDPEMMVMID